MLANCRPLELCLVTLGLFALACDDANGGDDVTDAASRDSASDDATSEGDAEVSTGLRRWVGEVDDSDIRLGAVVDGTAHARIYFCGGPSSYTTSTRWLMLDLDDEGSFSFEDGGWSVHGQISDDTLAGQISMNDAQARDFSAGPIVPNTLAGLYEGTADCGRVGLIVTHADPNDEPSGQGACVGAGHLPEQVNPLLPIAQVDGEIAVAIGGIESRVHPADPSMQ